MAGREATHLSKTFKGNLFSFESVWMFILEKLKEPFKLVSGFVCSIGKKLKESPLVMKIVGVTEDAANATLPYLKKIGVYCVDKIKQHPYMFGMIILFALMLGCCCCCKCCKCGSSRSRRMMKAPGRDYMMLRDDFEISPRSYFRDLRGKGGGRSRVNLC